MRWVRFSPAHGKEPARYGGGGGVVDIITDDEVGAPSTFLLATYLQRDPSPVFRDDKICLSLVTTGRDIPAGIFR